MAEFKLAWQGQGVHLTCPEGVSGDIRALFGRLLVNDGAPRRKIRIVETRDRYAIDDGVTESVSDLTRGDLASFLMDSVVRALIFDQAAGVVLHAGAVARNARAIMIAGPSGCGKTSLICWLVDNGYDYLTDETVLLQPECGSIAGLPRAVVVKPGVARHILEMRTFRNAEIVRAGTHIMIEPPAASRTPDTAIPVALVVFPEFAPGEDLSVTALSSAECGLQLIGCNLNARNVADGGFAAITKIARATPAVRLRYGDYAQLAGTMDLLTGRATDGVLDRQQLMHGLTTTRQAIASTTKAPATTAKPTIPAPTPLRGEKKALTIGMATYDDYDGVYFTMQALRMYHGDALDDAEILVVDNNPTGRCAEALKALDGSSPNYRYIPFAERTGTTVRERLVSEGRGDFILVMDCHVLLWNGALARLRRYMADHPESRDILQGPLVYDDLQHLASHFRPEWRSGMYGVWDLDPRAKDLDAPPFEIPMQGLGVYAFRRAAWPGFNPAFKGFGGEEGYLHEKFRRGGGRALCLPFLRWLHRFNRPMGVPYANTWEDRIRNYVIGFHELGYAMQPLEAHFTELLGKGAATPIFEAVYRELDAQLAAGCRGTDATTAPSLSSNASAS